MSVVEISEPPLKKPRLDPSSASASPPRGSGLGNGTGNGAVPHAASTLCSACHEKPATRRTTSNAPLCARCDNRRLLEEASKTSVSEPPKIAAVVAPALHMSKRVSCDTCHQRHEKCDRQHPCGGCVEKKLKCVYSDGAVQAPKTRKRKKSSSSSSVAPADDTRAEKKESDVDAMEGVTVTAGDVEAMKVYKEGEEWQQYLDRVVCNICHLDIDEDLLILCDTCDGGAHTYCCTPPLKEVPEGDWFCDACEKVLKQRQMDTQLTEVVKKDKEPKKEIKREAKDAKEVKETNEVKDAGEVKEVKDAKEKPKEVKEVKKDSKKEPKKEKSKKSENQNQNQHQKEKEKEKERERGKVAEAVTAVFATAAELPPPPPLSLPPPATLSSSPVPTTAPNLDPAPAPALASAPKSATSRVSPPASASSKTPAKTTNSAMTPSAPTLSSAANSEPSKSQSQSQLFTGPMRIPFAPYAPMATPGVYPNFYPMPPMVPGFPSSPAMAPPSVPPQRPEPFHNESALTVAEKFSERGRRALILGSNAQRAEILAECTLSDVALFCRLYDVDSSGTVDAVIDRIVSYLAADKKSA